MDTTIPDGGYRVNPAVETQPPAFHSHREGDNTRRQAKQPRIGVPDEASRQVAEELLKMTPLGIADILLSDDTRRNCVHLLPQQTQRAITQALPDAARRRSIRQLQEQAIMRGGPIDDIVLTIIGTAAGIEAQVRGIIEGRLAEEAQEKAGRPEGQRGWVA